MQRKRTISLMLILALVLTMLSGCSVTQDYNLKEDGSGRMENTVLMSKEEWDALGLEQLLPFNEDGTVPSQNENITISVKDETIEGAASKVFKEVVDFTSPQEFEEMLMGLFAMRYNKNYFCLSMTDSVGETDEMSNLENQMSGALAGSNMDLSSLSDMKANMTMTFPYEVIESNGTISEDKKSVSWDETSEETRFYAIFSEADSEKVPVISGVKNGKAYNTAQQVSIDSDVLLENVTVNDKALSSDSFNVLSDGTYKVKATDKSGKSSALTFTIDTVKPTIKGVKNNKTYKKSCTIKFSDKGSGIKKATLNGKSIKTGKKVTKKGSYTLKVTDKAGNTKTVKFKVS